MTIKRSAIARFNAKHNELFDLQSGSRPLVIFVKNPTSLIKDNLFVRNKYEHLDYAHPENVWPFWLVIWTLIK